MEAETPGRLEGEREEIEMQEREEDEKKYKRPLDWFLESDKNRPKFTWKKGEQQYREPFFNEFNPRHVIRNKGTKDSRTVRKNAIRNFISMPFDIDEKAQYFKNLNIERGVIPNTSTSVLKFTYNGNPIKYYDPRTDTFSHETEYMKEFVKDVQAYHGLKSVEEVRPQIKSIMTDEKPRENLTPPSRPPTPPKPSMLNTGLNFVKDFASTSMDYFKKKADESLDNTTNKSFQGTADAYLEQENQRLRNQNEKHKKIEENYSKEIDRMDKEISQKTKDITDRDIAIQNLRQQISSTNENNEDLNQEIAKKDYELRQLKTELENLKTKKNKIEQGTQKDDSQIQELQNNLDLTASQILQRDEKIKMLKEKLEKTEEYVKRFPQEEPKYKNIIIELKNTIKESETNYKKLKDSYNTTKLNLEEVEKSFDEISKELESIKSLLESEKGKVTNLKQSQKELEATNKQLVEDYDFVYTNYKANKIYLEDVESDKRDTISKLESLQEENEKLLNDKQNLSDERVLELQKEKKSIEKELQDKKDSFNKLVESKENLEKDYKKLNKEFNTHKSQVNQYSKSMQQELNNAKVEKGKYEEVIQQNEELQQERDELIQQNELLSQSLDAYKLDLEAEKKREKLDSEKELQGLKDSNQELEKLQKQLKEKSISEEKFKRLFNQAQNKYDILKEGSDKIIASKSNNIDKLLFKSEIQRVRIEKLEEVEQYYIERVKVKDAEVQEQIDRVEKKEQEKEKLINEISRQQLLLDQYKDLERKLEQKTKDHNQRVTDLSGSETKRVTLEEELAEYQKERDALKLQLENLKKEMIDPKDLEEVRNHAKELSAELDRRERLLYDKQVETNHFRQETENLREYIRGQKESVETEMFDLRKHYEEKIEKREKEFQDQLKNYIRPGDLRAINLGLDKLDAIEVKKYSDEEFEKVMKILRTDRDRNRRIAENPSETSAKRRVYDRLRKNADYKIDLINHENGKAIETSQGRDIVLEDKKGILGALYRLGRWTWDTGVKYLGVLGSIVSIIGGAFYIFCMATGRTAVEGVKYLSKTANDLALNLPADILNGLLEGSKIIIQQAKNTLVILTLIIISFVLLYRAYISPNQTEFLISFLLFGGVVGGGYWYANYD